MSGIGKVQGSGWTKCRGGMDGRSFVGNWLGWIGRIGIGLAGVCERIGKNRGEWAEFGLARVLEWIGSSKGKGWAD